MDVCAVCLWRPDEDAGPLELEFRVTMSCPVWVLETEVGSSGGGRHSFLWSHLSSPRHLIHVKQREKRKDGRKGSEKYRLP